MSCGYEIIPVANIPDVTAWSLSTLTLSLTIANDDKATDFVWNSDNIEIRLGNGKCESINVSLPTITCTM
jgi:hypothetical protein